MSGRRKFLKKSLLSTTLLLPGYLRAEIDQQGPAHKPLILSTWNHGMAANDRAWDVLTSGSGSILDAVE